ncbi:hypothetical protein QWY79_08525 [Halomonas sabkhae]|uniref:hypothetical protein n=1 Tax=Halomonas sabkhae TaxID=626223 RepID=UPI0025B2B337|nr:hypothetical protein [Halomonas sabkhae]MDN3525316.1 hypothetical protein [Halomonas sabkhae]
MQKQPDERKAGDAAQDIVDVARALGVISVQMLRQQGTQLFGVACYSKECHDMVLRVLGVFDELPGGRDRQALTWFSDDLRDLLAELESGGPGNPFHSYAFSQRSVIEHFIEQYGSIRS